MTTKPTIIQASASSKMMSTGDQQSTSNTTKSSKRGKKFGSSIRSVLGVGGGGRKKRKKRTKSDRTMGGSSDNEEDNNNITTTSVQATGTSSSELPRVFTPIRDLTNMTATDADAHGKLSPCSVGTTETVSSVEEELPSRFDPPGSLSPSFRQFDRPIPSRRRTTGGGGASSRRRSSSKSGVKERNMVKLAKRYGEVAEELRHKNAEIEKLSVSQAVLKAKVENMKEQERWYKSHISQLIKGQAAFQANLESVNLSSDRQQSEIDDICRYHENLTMQVHQKHAKKYKELQMDLQEELAHIEGGCVALTDDEKTDEDDDTDTDGSVTTDLEKEKTTTMRDHLVVLAKKEEELAATGTKEASWGWSLFCGLLLAAGVASTLKFSKPLLLPDTWGVLPTEDKATTSLSSEFLTATKAIVDESLALFLNSLVEVVVPTEKETDLSTVTRIPKQEEGEEKVELFFNAVVVPEEMSFPAYDEEDMYEEDMWNTFGQRPNMSPPFHNLF